MSREKDLRLKTLHHNSHNRVFLVVFKGTLVLKKEGLVGRGKITVVDVEWANMVNSIRSLKFCDHYLWATTPPLWWPSKSSSPLTVSPLASLHSRCSLSTGVDSARRCLSLSCSTTLAVCLSTLPITTATVPATHSTYHRIITPSFHPSLQFRDAFQNASL